MRVVVVVIPAVVVGWPGRGRGCCQEAHLLLCCGEPWRRREEPEHVVVVVKAAVVVGWPGRDRGRCMEAHRLSCCGEPCRRQKERVHVVVVVKVVLCRIPVVVVKWSGRGR